MDWEKTIEGHFKNKALTQGKKLHQLIEQSLYSFEGDVETVLDVLDAMGFNNVDVKGNKIKVLVPRNTREEVMADLRVQLEPYGFEYDSTRGSSIGQILVKQAEGGNIYVLVKPDSSKGSAAMAGMDYEEDMASNIAYRYEGAGVRVSTAGFGHGSDLTISTASDEMTVELKTSSGADFGQFKLGYDLNQNTWVPIPTKQFMKNKELFTGLFNDMLKDYLNQNAIFPKDLLEDARLNVRGGVIVGLKPAEGTGELKQRLAKAWFRDRADLKVPVDFQRIANYYYSKGDQFIQIKGRGVYAFMKKDSTHLSVPLFSEKGKEAYLRFRIKPHMGHDGTHSFAVAIKLTILRSEMDLDNLEDLDMIVGRLL